MRIITGIYKGRHFDIPKTFKARPTTDFAKERLLPLPVMNSRSLPRHLIIHRKQPRMKLLLSRKRQSPFAEKKAPCLRAQNTICGTAPT